MIELCKRYAARVIKALKSRNHRNGCRNALVKAGIRPINNVVDSDQLCDAETNQPLHAFDYELLGNLKADTGAPGRGVKYLPLWTVLSGHWMGKCWL